MKYKYIIKIIIASTLLSTTAACSQHIKRISHKKKISKPKSITTTIQKFKRDSQRKELESLIASEKIENKPRFLKNVRNKTVKMWIKYFTTRGKGSFERYLKNGVKYQTLIEKTFEDYGLPKDLYYVGMIESGYYLKAKSHANAVGPWQFISSTAKRYGLTVKAGVDERQSIVKSTESAALFFQDLYNIFGSWELALSAYNAGEYGVIRRIRGANTRDYYELSDKKHLPKETRNYVPKVLAAMEVAKNPKKYGIKTPRKKINLFDRTSSINLKSSTSIAKIAKKLGVSKSVIKSLNPDLKWANTPYVKGGYRLIIPKKNYRNFSHLLAQSRTSLKSWKSTKKIHKVKRGDSLYSISKKYKLSVKELKRINRLRTSRLIAGQKLSIVQGTKRRSSKRNKRITASRYKVRSGDNLYSIARKNNTTISKIKRLNGFRKSRLYIGQIIKIPTLDRKYYTVRRGDYLLKIAKRFKVTPKKIKKMNSLKNNSIYPGQRLVVSMNN